MSFILVVPLPLVTSVVPKSVWSVVAVLLLDFQPVDHKCGIIKSSSQFLSVDIVCIFVAEKGQKPSGSNSMNCLVHSCAAFQLASCQPMEISKCFCQGFCGFPMVPPELSLAGIP